MGIFSCKSCLGLEKLVLLLRGQLADREEIAIAKDLEFRKERQDLIDRILAVSKPGAITELRGRDKVGPGLAKPPANMAKFPGTQSSVNIPIDHARLNALHKGTSLGLKGEVSEPEDIILDAINKAANLSNLKPV